MIKEAIVSVIPSFRSFQAHATMHLMMKLAGRIS